MACSMGFLAVKRWFSIQSGLQARFVGFEMSYHVLSALLLGLGAIGIDLRPSTWRVG